MHTYMVYPHKVPHTLILLVESQILSQFSPGSVPHLSGRIADLLVAVFTWFKGSLTVTQHFMGKTHGVRFRFSLPNDFITHF